MAHRHWHDANYFTNKGKTDTTVNYQKKHEQMSKQQQLIEQKKLEIQQRLDEKKKKETEEALKKLNEDKKKYNELSKSKRGYHGYSKHKHWSGKERPEVNPQPSLPANIFSNDGSFFQQFQKISGVKVEPRKKTFDISYQPVIETNNDENKIEASANSIEITPQVEDMKKEQKVDKPKERRWSSPERSSSLSNIQMSEGIEWNKQHNILAQTEHQPLLQQQVGQHQPPPTQQDQHQQHQIFTPQQIAPPPMPMNFPQFNPMQCGMMLPPPMTPSSIPPPAPMNPGLIPSPSPLQPYAIPPPSPLVPHSIPPPSPMVPHSIPPPSPLTLHSIPPPLPLRPQSIPPPLQCPPPWSMVPPPPPPPPIEEKSKNKSPEGANNTRHVYEYKMNIKDNVKDLFDNDDYSSEDDDVHKYDPSGTKRSDSESDNDCKPPGDSDSDKESFTRSFRKNDPPSKMELVSRPPGTESEPDIIKHDPFNTIVIEDTETQFPSDTKDSSSTYEAAPADLSSEGDSVPDYRREPAPPGETNGDSLDWKIEMKKEPQEIPEINCKIKNELDIKEEGNLNTLYPIGGLKYDMKVKEEQFYEMKSEIKQESSEISISGAAVKGEEPPKKKRKSRWASSDDTVVPVAIPPEVPVVPVVPPVTATLTPVIRPPVVGPVGMVVPKALGVINTIVPTIPPTVPIVNIPGMSGAMISKVTRNDSALVAYAMKAFGHTNLSEAEWKKAEDHYKINLLYQDMMRKKEELQRLEAAGKHKYEYDSDEETEGGTWEHKLRSAEMEATERWAEELTEQAKGKHHIGDFLPPDELSRFMEKYEALKAGREPDLSDYKEFKLKEDNVGFQMLQKLGWTEGQGLGPDGSGIMDPVNKAVMRPENQGLGIERPDDVEADDDEYDAYRKRMMLAYRFRPNPMNNPRRPYY